MKSTTQHYTDILYYIIYRKGKSYKKKKKMRIQYAIFIIQIENHSLLIFKTISSVDNGIQKTVIMDLGE